MLFLSFGTMAQSNYDLFSCRQYEMTEVLGTREQVKNKVCYMSEVGRYVDKEHIAFQTDRIRLDFMILQTKVKSKTKSKDDRYYIVTEVNHSERVYLIKETFLFVGDTTIYYLSIRPLRLNKTFKVITGTVLEVSNTQICDK
jgi:hypothetical protein